MQVSILWNILPGKLWRRQNNEEDRITMNEMYEYFNEFANEKDLTATSEDMLIKKLHDLEFDTKRKQDGNDRKFYWYGVRKDDTWKEERIKTFTKIPRYDKWIQR